MKKQKHLRTLALMLSGIIALSDISGLGMNAFAKENESVEETAYEIEYDEDETPIITYSDEDEIQVIDSNEDEINVSDTNEDGIIQNWILGDEDEMPMYGAGEDLVVFPTYVSINNPINRSISIFYSASFKPQIKKVEVLDAQDNVIGQTRSDDDSINQNIAEIYINNKNVKAGKYKLKFYYDGGETEVVDDKFIITGDPVVTVVESFEADNTRDYIYIDVLGINLYNKKFVPFVSTKKDTEEEYTELKTELESYGITDDGEVFMKIKKVDWPKDINFGEDKFKIEFKYNDKDVEISNFTVNDISFKKQNNILSAVYNTRKNQIECLFPKTMLKDDVSGNDASANDITINVVKDIDKKEPLCTPITASVDKNGLAVFKPDVKLIDKLDSSRFIIFVDDKEDNYKEVKADYPRKAEPSKLSYNTYTVNGEETTIEIRNIDEGEYTLSYWPQKDESNKKDIVMEQSNKEKVKDEQGNYKDVFSYKAVIKDFDKEGTNYFSIDVNGTKYEGSITVFPNDRYAFESLSWLITNDTIRLNTTSNYGINNNTGAITCDLLDLNGKVVKSGIKATQLKKSESDSITKNNFELTDLKISDLENNFYVLKISVDGNEVKRINGEDLYGYSNKEGLLINLNSASIFYLPYNSNIDEKTYVNTGIHITGDIKGTLNFSAYDINTYSLVKSFTIDKDKIDKNGYHYYTEDELKGLDSNTFYHFVINDDYKCTNKYYNMYLEVDKSKNNNEDPNKEDPNKEDPNKNNPTPSGSTVELAKKMKYNIAGSFSSSTGKIKYVSSSKSIASVSKKGLVTAKRAGEVEISATDGTNTLGTIKFVIKDTAIEKKTYAKLGEAVDFDSLIQNKPEGSTVTWKHPKKSKVITISDNGLYYTSKTGKYKVKATLTNKSNKSVKISATIKVSLPKINKKSITLKAGKTKQLSVKNTTMQVTRWWSSNINIAKVENGLVTAMGEGKCIVYAEIDGVNYPCTVRVK